MAVSLKFLASVIAYAGNIPKELVQELVRFYTGLMHF
jgi:hypothetical protein